MSIRLILVACLLTTSPAIAEMAGMGHGGSPADKANAAAMTRMMKDMHLKPSGDPDKDFARMMLPHHQGAIDMAKVELQYGKDPGMLALAKAVVAAQESEIATMRDFLAKRP